MKKGILAIGIILLFVMTTFAGAVNQMSSSINSNLPCDDTYIYDADVLIIGTCRTIGYDCQNPVWKGGYHKGNVTKASAHISKGETMPLVGIYVRIHNESYSTSFIKRSNDGYAVYVHNAEGTFYWGRPLKKDVTLSKIPPFIYFNCHAEKVTLVKYSP
jgi:hypothetical protein